MNQVWKKMKLKNSLKTKLIAAFLLLSLVPLVVTSIVLLNMAKTNTENEIAYNMKNLAKSNADSVDYWVRQRISLVEEMIQKHPEMAKGEKTQILSVLKTVGEIDKEFEYYAYVEKDGTSTNTAGLVSKVGERDYFKKMAETKKTVVSDMLINSKTGKPVIVIAVPIVEGGEFLGAIHAVINPDILQKLIAGVKVGENGFGYLISGEGTYLTHPEKERIGKKLDEVMQPTELKKFKEQVLVQNDGEVDYKSVDNIARTASYHTVSATGWKMIVLTNDVEVLETLQKFVRTTTLIILIVCILVLLISWQIGRVAVAPMLHLSEVLKKVAGGDLTPRLKVTSKDEIGDIAQNTNKMLESMSTIIGDVSLMAEQVAASSEELTASSAESVEASKHVGQSIEDIVRGSETQVQSAEQSSQAMEEMAGGIQRIAESSSTVADTTNRTAAEAKQGNNAIQMAVRQMDSIRDSVTLTSGELKTLGEHSRQIGDIVDAITQIASQTQMLSLNASIEAARAGEHGRGFAVVAGEVKKLAEQSAKSAAHITELIAHIRTSTDNAITTMDRGVAEVGKGAEIIHIAGIVFQDIYTAVQNVSDQIREVSAATEQMSAGSEEVSASMMEMLQISQGSADNAQMISAASEQQLASMEEVSSASESLSRMAQNLQESLSKFKI
ncbi:methyl-accepting chemotaxis protein [Paenibacillus sp. UNC499MF]|uniref:methyl-accepting chemotaxis protein n=1 Tax=Paenibacillus sp. UNC499MF TaxID=1502751 RepID=UPI00089FF7D4|nr:methyl-accepting chemotaxis protein [Paenibacillus sp. UNC499MF]SEG64799.1 methyl-accepting chemotaxis sensory transducer with Cache sensor [Paenibacillus sp. UNC499MF]